MAFVYSFLRALSSGVLNVLNAIIFGIWHVKLQNMSFIRCSICVIFLEHATVRSHIWKRTVHLYYNLYYFFILAGPTATVSLSPLSSLCLLISFIEMYQLSLSLHFFALSLSLSLSLYSTSLPPFPTKLKPEHQATSRHATQTRSTLSDRRPPTQPHKPDPPHPQQPMAWSPCHAMPPSLSCHPPRYRNLPPSDFS